MDEMHRLLKRQISKYISKDRIPVNIPDNMKCFLEAVNNAYYDFEKDRLLMERSIEITSKEYSENIEKINKLQAQLIHQEKMAGIGQLSAGIAHEINNPLGYIQSNMETLRKYLKRINSLYELQEDLFVASCEQTVDEYKANYLRLKEFIKENKIEYIYNDINDIMSETANGLNRIEKIVKSLLGFSRRATSTDFSEYDINKGIKDTLTIANNEIKYYAKVEENIDSVPLIMAIDGEINQVLLNIIVNAAYAIREKGVNGTIRVRTYHEENYVYCEISDDGIGIPEANLKRIFEPFFTTKPVGTGTGLGLSIVHDIIVNKHSGCIEVKSEVGKGTTFTIALPIHLN